MYELTIADNMGSYVRPLLPSKKEALKRRTLAIKSYLRGGFTGTGYQRSSYTDDNGDLVVRFDHAIYSTVIFRIHKVKS